MEPYRKGEINDYQALWLKDILRIITIERLYLQANSDVIVILVLEKLCLWELALDYKS